MESSVELFRSALINGLNAWEEQITQHYKDKYDDYSEAQQIVH